LRVLTFFSVPLFVAVGFLQHSVATAGGGVTAGLRLDWMQDVILQAFLLLLVCALVFPTEDANVSRRNRSRFGRWTGLWYPLRIFAPGAFWGFAYTVLLAALTCAGLFLVWDASYGVGADEPLNHFVQQALLTLPLYVGAVGALGFFLAACDFTPLYSRLTTAFIFIITLLLPVIFLLSGTEQEEAWTNWDVLWRGYYLSPITLSSSLADALSDEEKHQFILFGRPVIEVARIVYGAVIVALVAGGAYLSRRAGYPVLRMHVQGRE
jgi:cell division protein FtsW (lipid II flippase)